MATLSLQGQELHSNGELPAVGTRAPDFTLVNGKLENCTLESFTGRKKLISIVPSLDTSVCATSTKRFNDLAKERDDIVVLIVSADLPFAQERFCGVENTRNVVTLSMMRSRNFAKDYGVLLTDGPLEGITARAVVVLDEGNNVVYGELVPDIASEPNYEAAIAALA